MRKRISFAAAGVLAASLVVAVPAGAQAATAPAQVTGQPTSNGQVRSVTLLTGDQVQVPEDGGPVTVTPAKGRERIAFSVTKERGHVVVVPDDAYQLVVEGKLDKRLFDVTTLIDMEYDDASRGDVPLLVSGALPGARRAALTDAGAAVVRELRSIGGVALRPSKKQASNFWAALTAKQTVARAGAPHEARALAAGVDRVWLDGKHKVALDESVPQIGAPAAHAAGFDGTGVKVAILDTGIDLSHPDLAGKVVAEQDFTGEGNATEDPVGHGTHVASTVAGSGAASSGQFTGVAPGAQLLNGRVCLPTGCDDSAMIAGMEWAAAQGAAIANMSIGGTDSPELDPVEEAVNRITAESGMLFVVSAGNNGSGGPYTINSPGSADSALTVGAVTKQDEMASLSSRGPRVGDGALKPDITAPGIDITAAWSSQAFGGGPDQRYASLSGTSMAAPHVSGAAAILKQEHPTWTAAKLKATLMASAHQPSDVSAFAQGAGRVDVARAIDTVVTADPPSISFGQSEWPFDNLPAFKDFTFRNDGAAAVTLDLALLPSTGADGPPPDGLFSLSTSTVTVPAGGTAAVRVNIDTSVVAPEAGKFTARVAGSVGGSEIITVPVGVDLLRETHRLTLRYLNRNGAATLGFRTNIMAEDGTNYPIDHSTSNPDLSVDIDLPPGRYTVFTDIITISDEGVDLHTLLVQPQLDLTADTTLTLDARVGQALHVTVPTAGAELVDGQIGYSANGGVNAQFVAFGVPLDQYFSGQVGPDVSADEFTSYLTLTYAQPSTNFPRNSPYAYHLGWLGKGEFITGVDKDFTLSELARVDVSYGSGSTSDQQRIGQQFVTAYPMTAQFPILANFPLTFSLPTTQTEYYSTGGDVRWMRQLDISGESRLRRQDPAPLTPGSFEEKWNDGPFGPGLQFPATQADWVTRTGDVITAQVPAFSDRYGNPSVPTWATTRTELYRDGEFLADTHGIDAGGVRVEVPAAQSSYELRLDATPPTTDLSTRVQASWTFQSQTTPTGTPTPLPLMVARFLPELDAQNRAVADQEFSFPVVVERQPGSAAPEISSVAVDVSYDDGQTWVPATVSGSGESRTVTVTHPAGDGYVSLRARVADADGNTVDQTIIHAYKLGAVPPPPPVQLRAQYQVSETAATTNQIHNNLAVVNDGDQPVALSDLTVRYWYTANGTQSQEYNCDFAPIGCSVITGGFTSLPSPRTGADTYLELSFTGTGTLAPGASTGAIQNRWHKVDWSNYQQTDDYSFDATATALTDATKVTVYYQGQLVWGTEP